MPQRCVKFPSVHAYMYIYLTKKLTVHLDANEITTENLTPQVDFSTPNIIDYCNNGGNADDVVQKEVHVVGL